MTIRATTILNKCGDTTIAWTEDRDEEMAAIIAKKMAEGITFFIIEPRLGGFLPSKKTKLTDPAQAMKGRTLSIPDEDFLAFVSDGKGETIKTPSARVKSVKVSRDPKEVARSESVGVQPRQGG